MTEAVKIKAHIKPTKQQMKIARELVTEEMERQSVDRTRRMMKIFAWALRDSISPKGHGMGKVQISKYIARIDKLLESHAKDREFWEELDYTLIDQMGLEFEREDEDESN